MNKHQYQLQLIQHQTNGSIVKQRKTDGYINATELCHAAKKKFPDYSKLESTKAFLRALSDKTGIPVSELIQELISHEGVKISWIHPKVATHIGQWLSADFAVQVADWIYDWVSKNTPAQAPAKSYPHMERYVANDSKVSPGYFSILQETALGLIGPLHNLGFDIPKTWVPDISVGKAYCKWLRDNHQVDTDSLQTYIHTYGDNRKPVAAKQYPDEFLADYRRWFRSVWLPANGVAYFKRKDPNSLIYLDQLPALANSSVYEKLPYKKK